MAWSSQKNPRARYLLSLLKAQNNDAAKPIETGRVSTQAISRLRIVPHCKPEWLAAIVPATPDDKTWVVLTGNP